MRIAVDFDGTIVEHRYPEIGRELPFATATLRQLMADGHQLFLWSVREGDLLEEAVEWCSKKGVRFHAVNSFLDEDGGDTKTPNYSRKLKVDCFIDDLNIGGLPDWGAIYQMISRHITYEEYLREQIAEATKEKAGKKPWWKF